MTRFWFIGAAAFLSVILIASVVLALTADEAEFTPGTAEHAVQTLLRAAVANDIETAYDMLSAELQVECELQRFAGGEGYRYSDDREIRATLSDTDVIGGVTFVDVQVTEFYSDGPFNSSELSSDRRFALRQENGEWKFTEYPWPYNFCPESGSN